MLQVQCFAAITVFLIAAWQPTLFGMGRVRASAVAIAVGLATLLVAGLVLIPPFEAMGAAIAAVVADVTLCVAVYVALRLAGPGPWLSSVDRILRVAVAAGIAVGVGLIPGVPIACARSPSLPVYLAARSPAARRAGGGPRHGAVCQPLATPQLWADG